MISVPFFRMVGKLLLEVKVNDEISLVRLMDDVTSGKGSHLLNYAMPDRDRSTLSGKEAACRNSNFDVLSIKWPLSFIGETATFFKAILAQVPDFLCSDRRAKLQ